MQKQITVKARDGAVIYCTLNSAKKSDKVIVFIHGFTGHINEHIFYNAVKFFTAKGFDTCRVSLYTYLKGARQLLDCTIDTHTQDMEDVISALRKKYKKIYVVGHSLGGPTILRSPLDGINAVVLWDPSHEAAKFDKEEGFETIKPGVHSISWGVRMMFSDAMLRDWGTRPLTDSLVAKTHVPLKLIYAGKSSLSKRAKEVYGKANKPKAVAVIPGASHCFDEPGTEEKLFAETFSWLKKF